MKIISFAVLTALMFAGASVQAQQRMWRCGSEYTNDPSSVQKRGCKIVEGGNVTVIQSSAPPDAPAASGGGRGGSARAPAGSPRVEGVDQRARDGEARSVLDTELRKAEARQAQLATTYNNGEPEKEGSESKNYQKYLDRVADMKAEIARNESDIAGLRRELGRLPATP